MESYINKTDILKNPNIPTSTEAKIGLCGFKNMGNTCYMNSILQLLMHSRTIINFLLCETNPYTDNENNLTFVELIVKDLIKAPFINFLKENTLDKLADQERKNSIFNSYNDTISVSITDYKISLENSLTIKLADIINTIIYKGNSCITPNGFKKIIDKKIPALRGYGQQDAHELLIGIFDILIEETCVDSSPVINNVPDSIKEYKNLLEETRINIRKKESLEEKKKCIEELNKYKKINKSVINNYNGLKYMSEVFGNKRKNSFDTTTTGYNSLVFNLLTLNVNILNCTECSNSIYKYEFSTILSLDVKDSLYESFQNFVKNEIIERRCEICNNNKTIKRKQIWRPGMLLYIQLCRFHNLPNGHVYKNNKSIKIPDILDISEFCDNSMKTDKSLTYKYKLKAISNHMGSLNGGHYTADAISIVDNLTWYNFNDSQVGKHQQKYINSSSAYILMYEMELS